MSSKLEKIENNVVKLTIEVDAKSFEEGVEKAYHKSKGRFNIPGFRKGKAPRKMIERMYGEGVFFEEAFNIVCPEAYDKAVEENKINPVDRPELDVEKMNPGENLVFTATVTIKPEVNLGEYKNLEIEKDEVVISDEDVEKEILKIQEKNARLISVEDRPAKENDSLNIDFEGFIDGEAFKGGAAKGHTLILGSNTFIPGFEEQLIGVSIGEEKDINVTFPEDYHSEDLKGKPTVFKVKVNEIKYKEVPELDDDFAKDVSEFDTLSEYKEDIKNKLYENAKELADRKFENDLIAKAVDNSVMDVPDVMVERQVDNILRQFDSNLRYQGATLAKYMEMMGLEEDALRNEYREKALNDVKTQLVLEEISKKEGIEASDDEVEEELISLSERYKQKIEDLKKHLKEDDIEYIKETIISRKTIELIKSSVK